MDEIKLRYFISVARHLNFSQAAAECHVSQSTISRQIAVLEKDLGVRLFVRDTQSVRLTDAGQRLFSGTHTYMTQYQAIDENIRALLSHTEHRVQVTVGPFEFPLVGLATARFRQQDPEMELHPVMNRYNRIVAHIRAGTINLAFGIKPCLAEVPKAEWASLGTYQWKAVARRDSAFWDLSPEQQARLEGQKVVISPVTDVDPVRTYLQSHDAEPAGYSYSGTFNLVCSQVYAGDCVALLPEYLEPWLHPDLRMEQVFPEPLEVESVLIYNPESPNMQDKLFFEYIRDNYKP